QGRGESQGIQTPAAHRAELTIVARHPPVLTLPDRIPIDPGVGSASLVPSPMCQMRTVLKDQLATASTEAGLARLAETVWIIGVATKGAAVDVVSAATRS